jgi:hypothetical protein
MRGNLFNRDIDRKIRLAKDSMIVKSQFLSRNNASLTKVPSTQITSLGESSSAVSLPIIKQSLK